MKRKVYSVASKLQMHDDHDDDDEQHLTDK